MSPKEIQTEKPRSPKESQPAKPRPSKAIQTEKPRLFVSHKQSDASIAKSLADFLNDKSGYSLDIHFSSSPEFEGPRIGRNLNAELRKALHRTDALILVYTTEDQDWAYCMWECGLATDPGSPDTAIYVFQCGLDVPSHLRLSMWT